MRSTAVSSIPGLVALSFVCTAGACVQNAPLRAPIANELNRVWVNNEEVATQGNDNLLDVLRRRTSAFRLGEQAPTAKDRPFVVVDGVAAFDGLTMLSGIPAFHAESVDVLRPPEAMARYGAQAAHGAIVVTSKVVCRPACR